MLFCMNIPRDGTKFVNRVWIATTDIFLVSIHRFRYFYRTTTTIISSTAAVAAFSLKVEEYWIHKDLFVKVIISQAIG